MAKTYKKTYGASGYMDWIAQIQAGQCKVKVHFTGGALTQYGITPAEFTTDNPFFQRIIEGSQFFKDGRITLLRTLEINTPDPQPTPIAAQPTPIAAQPTPTAAQPTLTSNQSQSPDASTVGAETEPGAEAEPETDADADPATEIEVTCVADAQAYINEHYGIPTSRVRTRELCNQAVADKGISFIWT